MDGAFKVLINGTETASILTWNKTHTFVYFTYDQGLQNVAIVGEIVTRIRNIKGRTNEFPITDVTGDGIVNILDFAALAVCNNWNEDR
jgi:hypothetical protein